MSGHSITDLTDIKVFDQEISSHSLEIDKFNMLLALPKAGAMAPIASFSVETQSKYSFAMSLAGYISLLVLTMLMLCMTSVCLGSTAQKQGISNTLKIPTEDINEYKLRLNEYVKYGNVFD
jgi:hypothetical protein